MPLSVKESNHFDVRLTFKREERSKDSNGTNKIFTIVGEDLFYNENYWGFKSEKRNEINRKTVFSKKESVRLFSFALENGFNKTHTEIIKIDKKYSFTNFSYTVELCTKENKTIYQIQSNDLNSNHKPWVQVKGLFKLLTNFLDSD